MTTKLAKQAVADLAPAAPDELAMLDGLDALPDGLAEVDRDDIKIRTYLVNMKGTAPNGRKIPEDEYFDTVAETTKPTVDAVLLTLHKTNLFSYWDNGLGKTVRVCSSYDRVTGTMQDTGVERPCKGCPDAKWRKDEASGKPTRNCGPVYNTLGIDRETRQPFITRFKRTSLKVLQNYLSKHHINQRVQAGKYSNVPFYVFQVAMSVVMSADGKYALPVLTRGPVLTSAEVHGYAQAMQSLMTGLRTAVERAESQDVTDSGDDSAGGDTSFDTDKYVDQPANQQGFVE